MAHLGGRVGGGGYGKGDKHLVHVQPGIVVAKVIHLQILYGLYHYGGYEVHILLYPAQALECVEQHGSRSAKELSGLAGDYSASGSCIAAAGSPVCSSRATAASITGLSFTVMPSWFMSSFIFSAGRAVAHSLTGRAHGGVIAAYYLLTEASQHTSSSVMQFPAMFTPMSVGDL